MVEVKSIRRGRGATEAAKTYSKVSEKAILPLQQYLYPHAAQGITLLLATVVALIWANTPWRDSYQSILDTKMGFELAHLSLKMSFKHWVNDGLMALFFLVVGLEIKREFCLGALSGTKKAMIPAVAALGGMVVPASIYAAFNWGEAAIVGWGIPMATDIAFAVGMIALFGKSLAENVRVLVLAIAIVDDIGAILVIALFYSGGIALLPMVLGITLLAVIMGLIYLGVRSSSLFAGLGLFLWLCFYASGVHATLAGVLLGLLLPIAPEFKLPAVANNIRRLLKGLEEAESKGNEELAQETLGQLEVFSVRSESLLQHWERTLFPWVTFFVLPIFAFCNAGTSFSLPEISDALHTPWAQGIISGLFIGKPLGIMIFTLLAVKLGIGKLPDGVGWAELFCVAVLTGIGFTVALFINELAFRDDNLLQQGKVAILLASILAAGLGALSLYAVSRRR